MHSNCSILATIELRRKKIMQNDRERTIAKKMHDFKWSLYLELLIFMEFKIESFFSTFGSTCKCNYAAWECQNGNKNRYGPNVREWVFFHSWGLQRLKFIFFYGSVLLLFITWKVMEVLSARSIPKQSTVAIQQWRNFYRISFSSGCLLFGVWCTGGLFDSATFIGTFHNCCHTEWTSCGSESAQSRTFSMSSMGEIWQTICSHWQWVASQTKCRNAHSMVFWVFFYACTWAKVKLILNKCKLSCNFVFVWPVDGVTNFSYPSWKIIILVAIDFVRTVATDREACLRMNMCTVLVCRYMYWPKLMHIIFDGCRTRLQ